MERLLAAGSESFYGVEGGARHRTATSPRASSRDEPVPENAAHLRAEYLAKARRPSARAERAAPRFWDLGDGVLCLEFHSKMNAIGDDISR